MTTGDWIQLASVLVALGLGVYGVLRDRGQKAELDELRRREQAGRIAFWEEDDQPRNLSLREVSVRNDSSLTITHVEVFGKVLDSGDNWLWYQSLDSRSTGAAVAPGQQVCLRVVVEHPENIDTSIRLEFTDSAGRRWARSLSGQLEEIDAA